jgi:hypothetical protein
MTKDFLLVAAAGLLAACGQPAAFQQGPEILGNWPESEVTLDTRVSTTGLPVVFQTTLGEPRPDGFTPFMTRVVMFEKDGSLLVGVTIADDPLRGYHCQRGNPSWPQQCRDIDPKNLGRLRRELAAYQTPPDLGDLPPELLLPSQQPKNP